MAYPCDFASNCDIVSQLNSLPYIEYTTMTKVRTLGTALYGKVEQVVDPATDISYACKKMPRDAVINGMGMGLESAANEIFCTLALQDVAGPNNIRCRGAFQDETHFYLFTEFCPLGELFGLLQQMKHFSKHEQVLRELASQLFRAVRVLHNNGVCHRDISLENLFVAENASIRLGDYGQAIRVHGTGKDLCDEAAIPITKQGMPTKVGYRSPEMYQSQIQGKPYMGKAADVFACGVLMYTLAMGSPPFAKSFPSYLFPKSFQHADPSRCTNLRKQITYSTVGKAVPEGFVDLLERLMSPDPAARMTIDEALAHPWVQGVATVPTAGPKLSEQQRGSGSKKREQERIEIDLTTGSEPIDIDVEQSTVDGSADEVSIDLAQDEYEMTDDSP